MLRSPRFLIAIVVVIILVSILIGLWTTYRPVEEGIIFPIVIQDDLGRNVTLVKYPEKIVSLAPVNTEILFALGLESRVIGVTEYCDYPPEVKDLVAKGRISIIGGYANPSVEKIIALEPDLILAVSGIQVPIIGQLEKHHTIVVLEPKNLDDILHDIFLVGEITGHTEMAQKLVKNMTERMDRITRITGNVDRPRVYYELWFEPLMTFGPETWVDALIELAGGVNIFHDAKVKYPKISSESVIKRNPQVIIVNIGYMGGVTSKQFKTRPGWELIDAVENERIYEINENLLIRPGPRIVDGLEALAKAIHPELFKR